MRIFGLDFVESTHNTAIAYTASYEWYIVLMSCTVAWIGTFAGLNTVSSIRSSQTRMGKIAWGFTGAFALGCAVWSMHFVGMLDGWPLRDTPLEQVVYTHDDLTQMQRLLGAGAINH